MSTPPDHPQQPDPQPHEPLPSYPTYGQGPAQTPYGQPPQQPYGNSYISPQGPNYPQPHPYRSGMAPAQKNGFGIAALVLAIVGLVFGLIPFTGFIALICGALAVLFGLLGFARTRKHVASNKVMSLVGTGLGSIAVILGVIGIVIVFSAVEDLSDSLDNLAATEVPVDGTDLGEGANPYAVGQPVKIGDWEVTIRSTELNANAAIAAANQFNDPPEAGRQYVMGSVTVKYNGEGSETPWVSLSFKIVGAKGNTFGGGDDRCGVVPDELSDEGEMFNGASANGNVCASVPVDQIEGARWLVAESFSFKGDQAFIKLN